MEIMTDMQADSVYSSILKSTDVDYQLAKVQAVMGSMQNRLSSAVEMLSTIQNRDKVILRNEEHSEDKNLGEEKEQHSRLKEPVSVPDILQMVMSLKIEIEKFCGFLKSNERLQTEMQQQITALEQAKNSLVEELMNAVPLCSHLHPDYQDVPVSDQESGVHKEPVCEEQFDDDVDCPSSNFTFPDGISTEEVKIVVELPLKETPFSNSSLTLAANRSLDMSQSLTDRCIRIAELTATTDNDNDGSCRRKTKKSVSNELLKDPKDGSFRIPTRKKRSYSVVVKSSPYSNRRNLCRSQFDDSDPKSALRYQVVQEISETERKYCSCLWLLLNHFADSFKNSSLLSEIDISITCPPCMKLIYDCHSDFFKRLEERLFDWSVTSTIGDLFNQLVQNVDCDLLTQYQMFVAAFPNAILHIRKLCRQNIVVEKFVKDLEMESCCEGLDIGAYLLTPIQRIPRYVLLLKQLSKYTDANHPDLILIDSCLSKLGDFLSQLNESIERSILLVSAESSPKPKRRFKLLSLSFRSNTGDGHFSRKFSILRRKKSNTQLDSKLSLDSPNIGLKRRLNEPKNGVIQSELCLNEMSFAERSSTDHMTSTPLALNNPQDTKSHTSSLSSWFTLRKFRRKLDRSYCESVIEKDTDYLPPFSPNEADFKKIVSLDDFHCLTPLDKAHQETDNHTRSVTVVDSTVQSGNMTGIYSCDLITAHVTSTKNSQEDSLLMQPTNPDLCVSTDNSTNTLTPQKHDHYFDLSFSQNSTVETDTTGNVSMISEISTYGDNRRQQQDISTLSHIESVCSSSPGSGVICPPKKKSKLKLGLSPKTEKSKKEGCKRKQSVRDILRNIFKRDSSKSKRSQTEERRPDNAQLK